MRIKMIEIRDEGTCIAAIAIQMIAGSYLEERFLSREGYPKDGSSITLMKLHDQKATNDPDEWEGRTMAVAHDYIIKNWFLIKSGQVVDVEVILGKTKIPKVAEIFTGE